MDPTYAGIKSDSSDPGYAGVGPSTAAMQAKGAHPYAVVNGIGMLFLYCLGYDRISKIFIFVFVFRFFLLLLTLTISTNTVFIQLQVLLSSTSAHY